MDKEAYLAAIESDSGALLEAALLGLSAPVPTCPGWTAGHVVAHVGRAYRWIGEIVETRSQTPVQPRPNDHSFDPSHPGVGDWFRSSLTGFLETMWGTEPAVPVWSWSRENTTGFWLRLMSHETALHRYDAQSAHSCTTPIDAAVARDAIDGWLDWFVPFQRTGSLVPGRGETVHFHQTDGDGEWTVRFAGNEAEVSREPAPADMEAEGTASDILLYLWSRTGPDRLALSGDASLADRFRDLIPPL